MIKEPALPEDSEVLLFFCGQYWDEIRHTENQRAMLTNLIILIASGVLGLSFQQGMTRTIIPLAVLMIILGLFGVITTMKLYERYMFLQTRLDCFYEHIDVLHPKAHFKTLKDKADTNHKRKFPVLDKIRVHWLWLLIHGIISVAGVILLMLTYGK